MRKLLLIVAFVVIVLATVLVWRTLRFKSRQVEVEQVNDVAIERDVAAEHLAQAVRFQTISYEDEASARYEEFTGFQKYLMETFPRVHQTLTREQVNGYSLLYTWQGSDETLKPVILAAHQDVVPVETGTEGQWTQPPFEGRIAGGFIWGRGSIDDKMGVMGNLEAVEMLLGEGFKPRRTVYLAFGHDEEIGGLNGAAKIAELLRSRNVRAEYVLDEGGAITEGVLAGLSKPVALVGTTEKGMVSVQLLVRGEGGHSSQPPPQTAIGILSAAIERLEAHQMSANITGVTRQMFEYVGPEMPFMNRLALANLWLFEPIVEKQLSRTPATNAIIRTTTAATVISGGVKENVLPVEGRGIVNFRIRPGDSVASVLEHVREVVDDPRVEISRSGRFASEPSIESDANSANFRNIEQTIRQIFPSALVAPYLVVGGTDARHYTGISKDVYRFVPLWAAPEDLKRLHGVNERLPVANYEQCIKFYRRLILNSAR